MLKILPQMVQCKFSSLKDIKIFPHRLHGYDISKLNMHLGIDLFCELGRWWTNLIIGSYFYLWLGIFAFLSFAFVYFFFFLQINKHLIRSLFHWFCTVIDNLS